MTTAIAKMLTNYRMDVSAIALDDPSTAVDERCFIANPAGTPSGTVRLSQTTLGEPAPYAAGACTGTVSAGGTPYIAQGCAANTRVNFRVDFANNCVHPSTTVDQYFNFNVVVRGNDRFELERIPLTIVVPRATIPTSGTYWYNIDASTACGPGQQPSWRQVFSDVTLPSGTSIQVDVRTAASLANLASAPLVRLGTITSAPAPALPVGSDIAAALTATMQSPNLPYLQVRFTLFTSGSASPVLNAYRTQFSCIDNL